MFPTCVGMNRRGCNYPEIPDSVYHTRGDEPNGYILLCIPFILSMVFSIFVGTNRQRVTKNIYGLNIDIRDSGIFEICNLLHSENPGRCNVFGAVADENIKVCRHTKGETIGPAHDPTRMRLLGRVAPSPHTPMREGQTIPLGKKSRMSKEIRWNMQGPGLGLRSFSTLFGKTALPLIAPMERSSMSKEKSPRMTQRMLFTPVPRGPVPALCLKSGRQP